MYLYVNDLLMLLIYFLISRVTLFQINLPKIGNSLAWASKFIEFIFIIRGIKGNECYFISETLSPLINLQFLG